MRAGHKSKSSSVSLLCGQSKLHISAYQCQEICATRKFWYLCCNYSTCTDYVFSCVDLVVADFPSHGCRGSRRTSCGWCIDVAGQPNPTRNMSWPFVLPMKDLTPLCHRLVKKYSVSASIMTLSCRHLLDMLKKREEWRRNLMSAYNGTLIICLMESLIKEEPFN